MVVKWPEYKLEKTILVNPSLNAGPDSFLLPSNGLIYSLGLSIFKIWMCGQRLGFIFSDFRDLQSKYVYLNSSLRLF